MQRLTLLKSQLNSNLLSGNSANVEKDSLTITDNRTGK